MGAMKNSSQAGLIGAVALWATPNTARRGGENPEKYRARKHRNKGGAKELMVEIQEFPSSPPHAMTTAHGLLLRRWSPPSCPRLNPAFAFWLMGMPWQILTCSASTAMPSYQSKLRSHFLSLLGGLGYDGKFWRHEP